LIPSCLVCLTVCSKGKATNLEEQIHPVATGHAAEIVAAHQAAQPLQFYSGYVLLGQNVELSGRWFCPFVQRAWIALEEGKLPYQYKEVNPYKKEVSISASASPDNVNA
jgi:hypothetical protein